ncbi:non-ribosomal peptide synthetase [Actinokineospora iranica]|uniref:Non-ribosomal peptide synthase domain TIGR01720/amino acid adenylation domain-containing protein n=1 Tax=Actinokineospora iranica TaxID=1271860 RepID=A0A1G6U5V2_9PSEU|nr:non-ribosomal peptide synthetase [Actinokineospora iranica]SDD36683.1 non-ribosomal peptide synthase domain TIGR01720/amino acid adenylation domain-containing protein [Actinokineospora iranica]
MPAQLRRLPLSAAQTGIWVSERLYPGTAQYNCGVFADLDGEIDAEVFAAAARTAVAEAEALRSTFREVDGVPVQEIAPEATAGVRAEVGPAAAVPVAGVRGVAGPAAVAAVAVVDLSGEADPRAAAETWMRRDLAVPLDLARGPLCAHVLFRLGPARWRLYFRYHHIVLDGFGAHLYLSGLAAVYAALAAGRTPEPAGFGAVADVAAEDEAYRASPRFLADRDFWADASGNADGQGLLGAAGTEVSDTVWHGAELPAATVAGLLRLCREAGVPWSVLAVTACAAFAHRVGGSATATVGLPVAARATRAALRTPTMLANEVPLSLNVHSGITVREALTAASSAIGQALRHQRYRGEDVRRDSGRAREGLYGLVANVVSFTRPLDFGVAAGALRLVSPGRVENLVVNLHGAPEAGEGVRVEFHGNGALHSQDEVVALHRRFLVFLAGLAEVDGPLGLVETATADERDLVVRQWNDTARDVPFTALPDRVAAQAARTPASPAVVDHGRTLTYADLAERVDGVAAALAGQGIGRGSVVALTLPRGADFLVAALAVARAGAAFLPIDATQPPARRAAILADATPTLVLDALPEVTPGLGAPAAGLPEAGPARSEVAARPPEVAPALRAAAAPLEIRPDDAAYVIYTSGSTGTPKGVVVEHRSLAAYLAHLGATHPAVAGSAVAHTSVAFDLGLTALFGPLVTGGAVWFADSADAAHAAPTFLKGTPSHVDLLERGPTAELMLGGETLSGAALAAWRRAHPDVVVVNEYGPTEATIACVEHRVEPGDPDAAGAVPIGTPFWNTRAYVLDAALRLVPPGQVGELYLAGAPLARGYLGQSGRTAERFVADPFGRGRMYRTGDLARWADGVLHCLGRADDQVKIRGFRVEPGEVEAQVRAHPDVRAAAVLARPDRAGRPRIVAYVVTGDAELGRADLRAHLASRLPEPMLPSAVVTVPALPLTPNGKLDTRALPDPAYRGGAPFRAPATPAERVLCALFAEVLGVAEVGADDDFFELGGDSLLATRLAGRVRGELGVELAGSVLFDAPTAAGLAERVAQAAPARPAPRRVSPRPARVPLSAAQTRLWLLERMENAGAAYNVPVVLRFHGPLDADALELAARDVVGRHETLRTLLAEDDDGPHQVVLPLADVVPLVRPSDDLAAEAEHAFALAAEVPVRLRVRSLGPREHVVLLLVHHVAADAVSAALLVRDLGVAYAARTRGAAPDWAPLPLRYTDYAHWQAETLGAADDPRAELGRQLAHWTTRLAGMPHELALPADRPRAASFAGARVRFEIPADLHERVDQLAATGRASAFMVVHAAIAALLSRLGAGTDIPVGAVVAGRTDPALDELVGFFVNTLVLRVDIGGDPTFRELLDRVRDVDLTAFAHQDLPFERLVERLNPVRAPGKHPLFQVMLSYQSEDPTTAVAAFAAVPGLRVVVEPPVERVAKYDLSWEILERRGEHREPLGFTAELEYSADRFDHDTARRLADRFHQLLRAAVADPDRPLSAVPLPEDTPSPEASGSGTGVLARERADAAPAAARPGERDTAPFAARRERSPRMEILRGMFAEVLGRGEVGVDDDFFALGGHSLAAVRLLSRVRSALGVQVPIRRLFEAPTVAGLAAALERADGAVARPRVTRAPRPARVPVSPAQQRLWFLSHLDGLNATYTIPATIRLRGAVDVPALRAALADVADRHESLRTVFVQDTHGPHQVVLPSVAVPLAVADIAEVDLPAAVDAAADTEFDLSAEPPLRAWLYRLGDDHHVLFLLLHHIAGDGASMGPLAADFSAAYTARVAGRAPEWPPLPVQYADYTLWQRAVLGAEDDPDSALSRQAEHWRAALAGLPEELRLPVDRQRPAVASYRGGRVQFTVDSELHAGIISVAKANHVTPHMVVQAAVATLLSRLGAGTDIPIGTPVAGRDDDVLDGLVGFFVNTLVLRNDLSGAPTFAELLGRVRETNLAAYANQDLPFERVVEEVEPVRSLARHPLFQVLLGIDDNQAALRLLRLPGVSAELVDVRGGRSKFDLSFFLDTEHDEHGDPAGMRGGLEYSADLFDEGTAEVIAERFVRVLTAVVADPETPVATVDILSAGERAVLLGPWHGNPHPVPGLTPAEMVAEQVRATPDAPAVVFGDQKLSYMDLNGRANRLARLLIEDGAGPERVVAIALPRSVDLPVAMLAAAKAGAAFLTVDTEAPAERVAAILADAAPAVAVTDLATAPRLGGFPARALDDPAVVTRLAALSAAPVAVRPDQRNPAYLVYTSGSTGTPKGVVMPVAGLVNLLSWHRARFGGDGRTAQFLSLAFDFVVQEVWQALVSGKALVLPEDDVRRDLERFAGWLDRHRVTELFAPTLVIDSLIEVAGRAGASLASLREVFQGGEAFRLSAELRGQAARGLRAHNVYGPAETHAATTLTLPEDVSAWPAVAPIGRPLWNVRVCVLDAALTPVPPGVVGELYIGGAQLARGYLNRPDRTAERFVADPYGPPGSRMYRTGDLVRWLPTGELDYHGRVDDQVKVRGFRVEPGEIEAVLTGHPGLAAAAVVPRADAGDTRLVAYLVPSAGGVSDWREVQAYLQRRLPDYLVPSAFVLLDTLPKTANGKLDRAALPAPERAAPATGRQAGSAAEAVFARAFAEVLGIEPPGADEGFFDLGGDSILSIQVVSAARRAGFAVSVRDVFERRTVAGLAAVATPVTDERAEEPGAGVGPVPLTPITRWLAERGRGGWLAEFTMSVVLRVPAAVDQESLTAAVQALVDHHDALRGVFDLSASPWTHEIRPSADATGWVRRVDVAGLPDYALDAEIAAHGRAARERLDPAGVPLQAVWFDRGRGKPGRLALLAHHLFVDGVSLRVLVADLAESWRAIADGTAPKPQPVGTSLRGWARRLTAAAPRRRGELDHWVSVLTAPDPALAVRPLDPATDTYGAAGAWEARLPVDVTRDLLTTVAAVFRAEVNDILLTAFTLALGDWRRRIGDEVLIHLEGHGREEETVGGADISSTVGGADLSRTVGWFTNLYPVRLRPGPVNRAEVFAGGADLGRALKRVKDQLRAVPDKGMGYGMLRYLDADSAPAFAGLGHPQVAFNYLGRFEVGGADADFTPEGTITAAVDGEHPDMPLAHLLELNPRTEVGVFGPQLVATWTWAAGLVAEDEVRALNDTWFALLTALTEHARRPGAGGMSTADVSLHSITQVELDEFEDFAREMESEWESQP